MKKDISAAIFETMENQFQDNSPMRILAMKNKQLLEDANIAMLQKDELYPNPLNEPYMEDVTDNDFEAMKNDLCDHGLFHNLVAIRDEENNKYRLISGEKRWRGILRMTQDEYLKTFPKGIMTKILPSDSFADQDDELIFILTPNVLVPGGIPHPKALRDLLSLYLKKGVAKQDLVNYFKEKLDFSQSAMYAIINECKAIKELQDLYNEKKMTVTALRSFGTLSTNDQKIAYKIIVQSYPDSQITEKLASTIKQEIKNYKKGINTSLSSGYSKNFTVFSQKLNSSKKTVDALKKIRKPEMTQTETEECIQEITNIINEYRVLIEFLKGQS